MWGARGAAREGCPPEEGGVVGVSHVAVHHEGQERGLAALQVVHAGPVGDVPIAAKKEAR